MSAPAFTPAPWRLSSSGYIVSDADHHDERRGIIARLEGDYITDGMKSDARLLAAAPRLYEALKVLSEGMDRAGGDGYGMPECPWCKCQYEGEVQHVGNCELLRARAALALVEGTAEEQA